MKLLQRRLDNHPVAKAKQSQQPILKTVQQSGFIGQNTCVCEGNCPRCFPVQLKLKINPPNDKYEQEADKVAGDVLRMPDSGTGLSRAMSKVSAISFLKAPTSLAQRYCDACEPVSTNPQAPNIFVNSLPGLGTPLPTSTRNYFESRLAKDLSQVRIHQGQCVNRMANSIQARAFTHQQNIYFNQGQYQPHTTAGKHLLAHELTHTLQQGNSSSPVVQRSTWENPPANTCDDIPENVYLEKIIVEQEEPQSVTLHWSNGSLDMDRCSAGKGLCCIDSSNPDGVAASVKKSKLLGTNCTPITEGHGYNIEERYVNYNGWDYWCEFVTSRGIALHQHHTVTGRPMSHGCVRLHKDTARKIFCGAVKAGQLHETRVQVRGYARPSCSDLQLQAEWRDDFQRGGANPADYTNDDDYRASIYEMRQTLNRAFGRKLSVAEIQALTVADIPRCTSTGIRPTTEEARLYSPLATEGTVPNRLSVGSGFEDMLVPLTNALRSANYLGRAQKRVEHHGKELWKAASTRAQSTDTDDRPLFWTRLLMTRAIRQWEPTFSLSASDQEDLITRFDRASRGMTTATFAAEEGVKKILISGYDPFSLNANIRRSNPTGAAALALDNKLITQGTHKARIQSVIMPVDFTAMDTGMVESFFRPYMTGENQVDMIVALGMNFEKFFEIEEWAGPPHAGAKNLATQETPPAFHRTTLPTREMRAELNRTGPRVEETEVKEIPAGQTSKVDQPHGPTPGSMAVEGSAGTYLCNEIFYRLTLLRDAVNPTLPVGFIHTRELKLPSGTAITDNTFVTERNDIIKQAKDILRASLPVL